MFLNNIEKSAKSTDNISSELDEYFDRYLTECQKNIGRIKNAKALLGNKHLIAKRSAEKMIENIRFDLFCELDDIIKFKLDSLDEIKNKLEKRSLFLMEGYNNFSISENSVHQKIPEDLENVSDDTQLSSYLSFDFKAEDLLDAKYSLGYIKTLPSDPKDLSLLISNYDDFKIGDEFLILVKAEKPWNPQIINSLFGFAEDDNRKRLFPRVVDLKDGTYVFLFCLKNYSKYLFQITLYGRPIRNSPVIINIKPPDKQKMHNSDYKKSISDNTKINNLVSRGESPPFLKLHNNDKMRINRNEETANDRDYLSRIWNDEQIKDINEKCESNNEFDGERNENVATIKTDLVTIIDEHTGVDLYAPIGVAVNRNNDIIICDKASYMVWILDECGNPKTKFGHVKEGMNLVNPSSVAIIGDGNFVIKDNCGLHLYNYNGNHIRSIVGKPFNRSFGLAVTKDEKLITLRETLTPTLYVFNKDGQLECNNVFEPLINRPENSKCRFMVSFSDEVIVSDSGLNRMYKTTINGKYIKSFGYYGTHAGAVFKPSGITLDSNGTMLIADSRNDRIQIFDLEGEYLGKLTFSYPVRRPSDITLTEDGHLYVLNYLNHYLAVHRLQMEE